MSFSHFIFYHTPSHFSNSEYLCLKCHTVTTLWRTTFEQPLFSLQAHGTAPQKWQWRLWSLAPCHLNPSWRRLRSWRSFDMTNWCSSMLWCPKSPSILSQNTWAKVAPFHFLWIMNFTYMHSCTQCLHNSCTCMDSTVCVLLQNMALKTTMSTLVYWSRHNFFTVMQTLTVVYSESFSSETMRSSVTIVITNKSISEPSLTCVAGIPELKSY